MKTSKTLGLIAIALFLSAFTLSANKLVTSKSEISFFSSTPAEDIEAHNKTAVGIINTSTGDVVFSVPMQGFEFEKALMQKHYNSDKFLDTKAFPKAKLKAKITNLEDINFEKDGTYTANIEGTINIKGNEQAISEKGEISIVNGIVEVHSKFDITLESFGISFIKGKPSSNIAKDVTVKVHAEYKPQ